MSKIKLNGIRTEPSKKVDKEKIKKETEEILSTLDDLQNLLYAQGKYSLLVILQGMDASGKDGLIRNVFGKLNPQGVSVHSFKVPSQEEAAHDFLWRIHQFAPAKGMVQIFNRSHYEDVLITRVHNMIDDELAFRRMNAINAFEELLWKFNNTMILKFYLHISKEEQARRLHERIENPLKHWKYNTADFTEAELWKKYMKAYEDCFEKCNKVQWHIIPSDNNWYKEYLVAKKVHEALTDLKMKYPKLNQVN